MDNYKHIGILKENRLLRSRKEFIMFQISLDALCELQKPFDPDKLPELYLVFDDKCEDHEVMWRLLHFVEDFDAQLGTDTLLSMTPQMLLQAADWCMLLHRRTLNNPETRKYYLEKLQQLSPKDRNIIKELFESNLRNETEEELSSPSNVRILETIQYIDTLANE